MPLCQEGVNVKADNCESRANGFCEPLKVICMLTAFGAKECRKQVFSPFWLFPATGHCSIGVRSVFDWCSIGVRLVFDPSTIQPCANQCPINSGTGADVRRMKGSGDVDSAVVK